MWQTAANTLIFNKMCCHIFFVVPLSQSLEPVIVTRQGNQFQLASETVITGNKISWNRWKNQLVLIFGYGSPK